MDCLSNVYSVDDEAGLIDIMVIENRWFDQCLGSVDGQCTV